MAGDLLFAAIWSSRDFRGESCPRSNRCREPGRIGSRPYRIVGFSFHADSEPEFQIQQSPNAVVVVPVSCSVLLEQTLYRCTPKESAIDAARFQKQILDGIQLRSG